MLHMGLNLKQRIQVVMNAAEHHLDIKALKWEEVNNCE